MSKITSCPFCGEKDVDLVWLKEHLQGRWGGCEEFYNTPSPEEESAQRNAAPEKGPTTP